MLTTGGCISSEIKCYRLSRCLNRQPFLYRLMFIQEPLVRSIGVKLLH